MTIASLNNFPAHRYQLIALLCFYLLPQFSFSQTLTGTLKEVDVEAKQKEKISEDDKLTIFSPGQKITHIDSLVLQQYKFQTIANLLSQQTPAFVKSYGFNGLATLNFRGASAAQSQVYWNGVPLQNAALGVADISTLPVAIIDKVNIVYGGSSALWGSGNVGGALMLENDRPMFDSLGKKDVSVSLSAGSFNQYAGGARLAFSDKRWYVSANGFIQSAKNNYAFIASDGTDAVMSNSELYSAGFMLNAGYRFSNNSVLSISGWYQHYDRKIPAALFERYSLKDRLDQSRRLLLHWKKEEGSNTLYFKSSIIEDKLFYNDNDSIKLHSKNVCYQFYNELGWKKKINRSHTLLVFIPFNYSWMSVGTGNADQLKTGLSAAYAMSYIKDRLHISLQASEQVIDTQFVFLPGVNASFDALEWLTFNVNVQRTYRAPTLNELYYTPGGNPALKPEQGWAQEIGYTVSTNKRKTLSLVQNTAVFNRDIRDWIVWFGGAIFTPHNIARVHSRGIETENMLRLRLKNCMLHAGLNTAYILATTTESYMPNDGSVGKQIPYAPRYNGQLNLGITYKKLYFNYNQTYTGYRFYTTDESGWVEPYSTANVQVSYIAGLGKRRSVLLTGQCNNIFNTTYAVVSQRPMPGVNWMVGARFGL